MLFLLLICVLGIWMFFAYRYLLEKKYKAIDEFEYVDTKQEKRYSLILDIISAVKNDIIQEQSLIEYISELREKAIDLRHCQGFINRKIALDKELENKTEQLICAIKENEQFSSNALLDNAIVSYANLNDEISIAKQNYNDSAKALRKAVDVFPTSFLARLNNIKSLDYMK